ncbi:MAG: TetR/AcrR family transcriptional regulator [Aquificota bacterium]|nr:MAG: TetR/AcrR family transcriptional regulator [Aquificota bacterium]
MSDSTKERILSSAKELFSQKGYHETTVEDIVRRAELSKGAFYFYFESKEDVVKELTELMVEKTLNIMDRWLAKDLSAEDMIKGHIKDFLVECYEDRFISYIFFFELMCKEEFRSLHFEKLKRIKERLAKMVKRGFERGEFKCGNEELVVYTVMGFVRVVYLELLLLQNRSLEEVLSFTEAGLELILRGLKCE